MHLVTHKVICRFLIISISSALPLSQPCACLHIGLPEHSERREYLLMSYGCISITWTASVVSLLTKRVFALSRNDQGTTSFTVRRTPGIKAIMNFTWKSTEGWSIGNILLDVLGGVTNYLQMAVQSIDQGSWVNFYGNVGKTLLSLGWYMFPYLICR